MIDIESVLFSEIATAVQEHFGDVFITGEFVKAPPSFPCISLVEMSNTTYTKSLTSHGGENHAEVMYELNVYSNKTKGKKAECKEIVAFIDSWLIAHNFTRAMLEPVPNQDGATIYRMLGRYRAVVSKDNKLYRR